MLELWIYFIKIFGLQVESHNDQYQFIRACSVIPYQISQLIYQISQLIILKSKHLQMGLDTYPDLTLKSAPT